MATSQMKQNPLDHGVSEIVSLVMQDYDEIDDDTNFFSTTVDKSTDTSGEVVLDESKMLNPFFVNIYGGPLMRMENKEIYSQYNRVIVVSLAPGFSQEHLSLLMEKYVDRDSFQELRNSLLLMRDQ